MNDSNAYYTPDITEFHVGFECEQKIDSDFDESLSTGWTKIEIEQDFSTPPIIYYLNNNEIRVKYLDQEDIESLRWCFKETTPSGLGYFWDIKKNHSIIYDYKNHRAVITIRDNIRKEDYTAFVGYINNKSELKKIMQQLNIF